MIIPSVFVKQLSPPRCLYGYKFVAGSPSLGMHISAVMSCELRTRIVRGGNRLVGRDNHINWDVARAHRDFALGQHLFSQG